MTDETKRWFIEKIAQAPEYLEKVYLPELEKIISKAEASLREANRNESLESIKYRIGWLDGAERCRSVIDGLRLSERKTQSEPGLMARIFSRGKEPSLDTPAGLG